MAVIARRIVVVCLLALLACSSRVSLDFAATIGAGGPPELAATVERARRARDRSAAFFFLDATVRRLPPGRSFVVVESHTSADDMHGFALITQSSGEYEITSNYVVEQTTTGANMVSGTGDFQVYRVPRNASSDALFTRAAAAVQPGFGGRVDMTDSDTYFLLQHAGGQRRAILSGVSFVPFKNPPDPATNAADVPRYAAIAAAFTLWFEIATSTVPVDVYPSP